MEHCKTNPDAIHLISLVQRRRKLWFMASLANHQIRHVVRDHQSGCYLNAAGDGYTTGGVPVNRGAWTRDEGQFEREEDVFGASGGAAAYRRELLREQRRR